MPQTLRLGVLTPSSNTAREPLTAALAAGVPGCSAHFSRFEVSEIALSNQALGQFDDSKILAAAELLAERITERTGIPATTAVLALNELLALRGVKRLALVTPCTADVQQRIVDNYRSRGIEVVAERHLGITVNHDAAGADPAPLRGWGCRFGWR